MCGHLLLSHIHLDHAGAAGVLVREHPGLQVHVSEIGAPHLVDPSRLERSARRLYGDDFDRLWGELAPVPGENIHVVGDETLGLATFPSPGHASHHVCYLDGEGTLYAGDAAGVRIRPSEFVLPPTPPPEVDLEAWDGRWTRSRGAQPERLALIHFGVFEDVERHLEELAAACTSGPSASATARPRSSSPRWPRPTSPPTSDAYEQAMPFWQSYAGLKRLDFETRAIHDGQEPEPANGSVNVPIYQTSTYVQEAVGKHKGYDYARVGNPTRTALELGLAALGGRRTGPPSPPAAARRRPYAPAQAGRQGGGGGRRLRRRLPDVLAGLRAEGLRVRLVPADELNTNLAAHLDARTRMVWLETPTNPLLNVVDIRAAAEAAHAAGALVVVDNTFASPYLQQPLSLGADVVVHSTTKYLGGHSDLIGGSIATNDPTVPSECCSCRSRSAPCPGRLTRGSCCAA